MEGGMWWTSFPGKAENLTKRKKQQDKFYLRQQSKQTKERLDPRVCGEELSLQSKPEDCPEWACIDSNNIITNSEFIPLNNYFLYKGHNLANHYANLDGMTLT